MKRGFKLILYGLFLYGCTKSDHRQNDDYHLISYLDIAVDSMGRLPRNPYVIDLANNSKRLVVVGTQHSYDSLNPMYQEMEQLFYAVKPDIIINEGGDLSKEYSSLNQAIAEDSDLGFDKYLADKAGIETVNGDEPQGQEFQELSEAYSKEEAIVFYGAERFMLPYVFGEYDGDLKKLYESKFIFNLMEYDKVSLTIEEQKFSYYQRAYEKYFNQRFDWNNFDQVRDNIDQFDFIPFATRHHFNEVARKSKELRDRYLLKTIEEQLEKYDTVMVVYGGWHVLAIEPALTQIIKRVK
jgi:hypothetical protein